MTIERRHNMTKMETNRIANRKETLSRRKEQKTNENETISEDLILNGGWRIALAMILILFTTMGPGTTNIIFHDFLEEQTVSAITLSVSMYMVTFSMADSLTNVLSKRYSFPFVGLIGAVLFSATDIMLAFVTNIYHWIIAQLFLGFGFGLMLTVINTIFNTHFLNERTKHKIFNLCHFIIGLSKVIYPQLIRELLTLYGHRGTAAIIGGISLNSIVGILLIYSVEQYAKKNDLLVYAEEECEIKQSHEVAVSKSNLTVDVTPVLSKIKCNSFETVKKERNTDMPLLIKTLKRVASMSKIESEIRKRANFPVSKQECSARDILPLLSSQCLEKRSCKEQINDEKIQEREDQKETKYKKFLNGLLDMSLIKNYSFLHLCFGVSFVLVADNNFSSVLNLILTDMGYTKNDVATGFTIDGLAEIASRILLVILTFKVDVKPKYLFFAAMVVMLFAKLGFLLHKHFVVHTYMMYSMVTLIGVARSWLLIQQPLVIIDNVRKEKIASAFGIYAIINCLLSFVIGYIVGLIKDWTGSYDMYQVFLLVVSGMFIIPWILQFFFVDLKNKQTQRAQETITKSSSIFHT